MGRPKAVAVLGTNASGKSSLGVTLAQRFAGEIISADSRQIYRGLDIGTGKLSPAEMEQVPHHLIDVADVSAKFFTLAEYQDLAYRAIDGILERKRLPIMVGGTGLYVRAIVEGYRFPGTPPDYARRQELEAMDPPSLWALLDGYDPAAAARFDPRNKRRIIRAIEIIEHRGRTRTRCATSRASTSCSSASPGRRRCCAGASRTGWRGGWTRAWSRRPGG